MFTRQKSDLWKGALKKFPIFKIKHICRSLLLVARLTPFNLVKVISPVRFALFFKKHFFTEHFQRIASSLDIFLCMPQLSALLNAFLKKHVYIKNLPHVFLGTCFFEDHVILYETNLTKFAIKFFERCFPFGLTWLRNLVSGQLPPDENCPPIRVGVWVKVRASFRVWGQPDYCPRGKLPSG